MPIPFSEGLRGCMPEYTDNFIFVCWDQLGCGINDYIIDNSFTINSFADMTVDLIKELKKEFPENPIFLLGTSWGSVLALKAADNVPELINGVLVMGQILKDLFFNDEIYQALDSAALSNKSKTILSAIKQKTEHNTDDIKAIALLMRKYTEGYQAKTNEKLPIGKLIRSMLASPDYTFKNLVAVIKNGFLKNTSIYDELLRLDLSDELSRVKTPYRILQGDKDIVTSTKNLSAFLKRINNPNLSFRLIKNCGHIPSKAATDELLEECIKLL